MRKGSLTFAILFMGFVLTIPTAWATPISITTDISFMIGSDIELEFCLFDNNGTIGDSYVLIDNVSIQNDGGTILGPGLLDFEDGSLEDFDAGLNPASVTNVAGAFPWDSGSRQLRIDEDPVYSPTIVFRTFGASDATLLHFEFEFVVAAGSSDSFVASLIDPISGDPCLIPGVLGSWDAAFLDSTVSGNSTAPGVTTSVIPEPSTILLLAAGLAGLGSYGGLRIRRRRKV